MEDAALVLVMIAVFIGGYFVVSWFGGKMDRHFRPKGQSAPEKKKEKDVFDETVKRPDEETEPLPGEDRKPDAKALSFGEDPDE